MKVDALQKILSSLPGLLDKYCRKGLLIGDASLREAGIDRPGATHLIIHIGDCFSPTGEEWRLLFNQQGEFVQVDEVSWSGHGFFYKKIS